MPSACCVRKASMRASSSATVAARRQPWPSPSYTCRSTVRRARAASALRLLGAHGSIGGPVQQQDRRADLAGERERRAFAIARRARVGQRTDEAQVVAGLEAVRRRREVEQIGDRVERDDTVDEIGCCAATSNAVKPPALPPISTTRFGSHQPSFTAWRIPAAVSATSRSPQRPASACVYARP